VTNIVNNTDLDKVGQTVADGIKGKQSLRKPAKLKGECNLDPNRVINLGQNYHMKRKVSH
jgi:hypothetical protein